MELSLDTFFLIYGMYFVPTAVLIGATILVARLLRKPVFLSFEYFSWLLPGLLYWLLLVPLHLEQAFRGKTLGNLGEPVFLGVICGVLFVLRSMLGAMAVSRTAPAAWWNLGLSNFAACALFILMPSLPE